MQAGIGGHGRVYLKPSKVVVQVLLSLSLHLESSEGGDEAVLPLSAGS